MVELKLVRASREGAAGPGFRRGSLKVRGPSTATTAAARGRAPTRLPTVRTRRRLARFATASRRGRDRCATRGRHPPGPLDGGGPVRHFFPARGAVDVDIGSSTSDAGARIAGCSCDSPPAARRGRARGAVTAALNRSPSASRPVSRDRAGSGFPRDDVDLARALETAPVVAGPPRRRPRGSRGPVEPLFRRPDARGGAGAGFRSISTDTTTLARAPRGADDELALDEYFPSGDRPGASGGETPVRFNLDPVAINPELNSRTENTETHYKR